MRWPAPRTGEPPLRPLFLFDPPQPVEVIAEVPDGPPHRFRWKRNLHEVRLYEGPERIASEWWKTKGGEQSGRGGLTRDPVRWFNDVVFQIEDSLKLTTDTLAWWEEHYRLGPMQRFMKFLEDVVLGEIEGDGVLFFDEIDSVLNLPFADDFRQINPS